MKVSIIQEIVPPYREAFFNQLNDSLGGNLTIYLTKKNNALKCDQRLIEVKQICGMFYCSKLPTRLLEESNLVVMMFDLRWGLLYQLLVRNNQKTVLWGHGVGSRKSLDWVKAALIRRGLGFIAYGHDGCQVFSKRGVPTNKLAYAGNTIEVEDHGMSCSERRYFLYLGRLQARKQLDQLIRAFAMLPESMQQRSRLLILGDGEPRSSLMELAKEVGVADYCSFARGSYDPKTVRDCLDSAIAYVSPGHVGLGVLHAFSCGVPVITKRSAKHAPEVENIIDGVNGFLTGDEDADVMNAMKVYLTSPELHQRHCIEAYRRYADHRTMPMMVQRFHAALRTFHSDL